MSIITLPGLIDPHAHLRDPGQTEKEDFYTGTRAALAGGFTTILDMPNNKNPIVTAERLNEKIKIAREKIVCDVGFYFGSKADNMDEFAKIQNEVFGLKLYLNETTGNFLIDRERIEKIFLAWNKIILLHAEDDAVAFIIETVRKTGKRAHLCHISTAFDLRQIIKAKEESLPITCGVTPHHLFLTEDDGVKLGPYGKMKPPLRPKRDVDFLWKNLVYIDCVESDHAPHTKEEKEGNPTPYGVPGLETTLPLLFTAKHEGRLTTNDIIRLCHINPNKIFPVSQPDTTVEIDEDEEYIIENKNLFTKCKWSPFNDWKVKGKIKKVFIRGTKVFENGKILAKPGFGEILKP